MRSDPKDMRSNPKDMPSNPLANQHLFGASEDVDYMAERCVLPILFISGGLTEQWNKEHPENKISTGAEQNLNKC